ncbi:hypothetical protein E3P99_02498 [Wallemia hederae]|uniref:Gamma-glutamyltransferase n=1 Tax=Wallemia hederae TaxID=1540922 RepID=A0A4T0FM99_9BASI|nr:hypothetical protein E3P99_02498 [Wallemia hederae]
MHLAHDLNLAIGIGGGGFALIRDENAEHTFVDFRETAPGAASEDMFVNSQHNSTIGGLAVGVPATLRGFEHLHQKYGRLPWSKLFEDAASVANGFVIEQDLADKIASSDSSYGYLREDPLWSSIYSPNGTVVGLGDTLSSPLLAETYKKIAESGADVFYNGDMAQNIVDAVSANGGIITLDDLASYKIEERPVLSIDFDEYKVYATSAPSSGAVLLNTLNTLQHFDENLWSNDNYTAQALTESLKFAYAVRDNLADPAFVSNVTDIQDQSVEQDTGVENYNKISLNQTHPVDYYSISPGEAKDHGTSHINAVDGTGLAISITNTINTYFGSHVMTSDSIILNNEMDDFSIPGESNSFNLKPSTVNFPQPGKRPQSSISPAIVENKDGRLVLLIGSAGGSQIPSAVSQLALNYLKRKQSAQSAVSAPRLHNQLVPAKTTLEYEGEFTSGFSNLTAAYLSEVGQNVTFASPGSSTANAIGVLEDKTFDIGREVRQANSGGKYV